ncbi:MAG: hypothetical protein JXQ30_03990 [Spirochaetes bacterium]|nr:hypothetical protein [Spirochaetota bacterium]
MKKILISIAAALVVLTLLYLFVERRVVSFGFSEAPEKKIPDLIGDTVDAEYLRTAGYVALRMKRRIEIEERKIDYLLQEIEKKDLFSGDIPPFNDYVDRYDFCEKIVVTGGDRRIIYSTERNDPPGRLLEEEILTSLVNAPSVAFDPLARYLLISRIPSQAAGEPDVMALFYYSYDLLASLFEEIEVLDYRSFVVLPHDIVLLNFPDVDPGDEANADRLFSMLSDKEAGSVRVRFAGSDVTVYYTPVSAPYDGITVGLAVETGEIGISTIGVVILISQTIVVLALLIFVFVSIGQKRTGPTGSGTEKPQGEVETVENQAGSGDFTDEPEADNTAFEGAGIMPLSDIEEVTEVEEIGEAEIAAETGFDDFGLPVTEKAVKVPAEEKKPAMHAESKPEPDTPVIGQGSSKNKAEKRTSGGGKKRADTGAVEHIEEDMKSIDSGTRLPDLGELVKGRIAEADGAAFREKGAVRKKDNARAASVLLKEPEETLEETVVIPEEVYQKTGGLAADDELSRLIGEMEGETVKGPGFTQGLDLEDILVRFLKNLSLSRGALLVRQKTGTYRAAVSVGLAERSRDKLKLEEKETFFRRFLSKGKLLYIRQDAFLHEGIRDKFDIVDASKIQSLFFAPVTAAAGKEGAVKRATPAILVVCVTTGERTPPEIIAKEINRIKRMLLKYL